MRGPHIGTYVTVVQPSATGQIRMLSLAEVEVYVTMTMVEDIKNMRDLKASYIICKV